MKYLSVFVLASLFLLTGCVVPNNYHSAPPSPCMQPVSPISGDVIIVTVPVTFNYTPKDQANGAVGLREIVLNKLNEDGKSESNSFVLQNGSALNFTFAFTVNNYNEMYSGSLTFSGWGRGFIHTFYTTGSYNDASKMVEDLSDQAYGFIRNGWHDSRANCPQN